MSNAVYDQIAEEYKYSKQLLFRKAVEEYTLLKLAGNFQNQSVLDLACGEGIYTRKFNELGAQRAVGVDISQEMVKLARGDEKINPQGCLYYVGDVKSLELGQKFDIIIGVYLLNYATSKEDLSRYCKSVLDHLKPGGKFIGINDNPFNQPSCYPYYFKYGFIKESPAHRKEGDFIKYVMCNPDGTTFSFNNYYLKPETYLECFQEIGFKSFEWNGPFLNPGSSFDDHWDYFMEHPPIIGFTAVK